MNEFSVNLTSEGHRRKTTLTTRRLKCPDCVAEIHATITRTGLKNSVTGWVELDRNQATELRDYLNEVLK